MEKIKEIIAGAIANARGMRRGMPPVSNILDMLPEKLKNEVNDDAENIIKELSEKGYSITDKAALERAALDIIAEYEGNTRPHVEQEGIHCNR